MIEGFLTGELSSISGLDLDGSEDTYPIGPAARDRLSMVKNLRRRPSPVYLTVFPFSADFLQRNDCMLGIHTWN